MRIPKVTTVKTAVNYAQKAAQKRVTAPNVELFSTSSMNLNADFVSFGSARNTALDEAAKVAKEITGGTKKCVNAEDKKLGARYSLAKQVHNVAEEKHEKILEFIRNLYDDLECTDQNKTKLIKKIGHRIKSEDSIHGKCRARHWSDFGTILDKMEDLNGFKLVLNNGATKLDVDRLLDRLIPYLKSGELQLLEIENKRPWAVYGLPERDACKYDYSSISKLEDLIDIQIAKWSQKNGFKNSDRISRLIDCREKRLRGDMRQGSNYTALHMIFRLPKHDAKFELQMMGSGVDMVKEVDDVVWKFLDGKDAAAKFNPIKKIIKPITREENAGPLENLNRYRAHLFLSQRDKELQLLDPSAKVRNRVDLSSFLKVDDYNLPPEFDFNYLGIEVAKCNRKADQAVENLKKATEANRRQAALSEPDTGVQILVDDVEELYKKMTST